MRIIILILIFIGGFLIIQKRIQKSKKFMPVVLFIISLSVAITIYPLFYKDSSIIESLINTIFYVIQSWLLNEDITLVQTEEIGNEFIQSLLSIQLLCLPLLTAGSILEILQKYFGKLKLIFSISGDIHIFSSINEKSIKLSKLIRKDYPKDKIVFCESDLREKNTYIDSKDIFIKDDITSLKIRNSNRMVKFYVIEEEEEKILEKTVNLVQNNQQRKCEILSFTSDEESKMILDALDKGNVTLNIIDELQNSIYQLLLNHPLYQNTKENKIKILLVGMGNVGKEVFKSVMWCGQMPQYTLEVNVIEKMQDKITELKFECPEIFKYSQKYHVSCDMEDIRKLENNLPLQDKIKGTNYIIIATENEKNNIKIAQNLRRFFLKEDEISPEIFVWMEDSIRKEKINNIKDPYMFQTFGSIEETYKLIEKNSEIEKMAIKLHLSYNPNDKKLTEYNKIEYNKKSSRATALHIKYKLYPYITKDATDKVLAEEINRILNDEKILLEISESEHERWLAYLRTEGYEFSSKEVTQKYYLKIGKIKNHFLKMHPVLTDWEHLNDVQKTISTIEKKPEKDLKESTKKSVIEMIKNYGGKI